MPLSWTDYGGSAKRNASCNGGKVLYATSTNTSTGQGSAWQKILDCEENDAEALLTYAAIDYLHKAVGSNGSTTTTLGSYRPFFIGMGHRTWLISVFPLFPSASIRHQTHSVCRACTQV